MHSLLSDNAGAASVSAHVHANAGQPWFIDRQMQTINVLYKNFVNLREMK